MEKRAKKIEYSNNEHPKLIMLQDGSVDSLIPLKTFVNICNASRDLVNGNGEFMSFTSNCYDNIAEMNNYIKLCSKMNTQMGDFFVQMKKKGAPLYLPDSNYFNKRLSEALNSVQNGSVGMEKASVDLNKEFSNALKDAIAKNEKNAYAYGVKLPYTKEEKTKE
ncbi:MAG: hypothetical protein ACI4R8_05200 [Candidatus Caccovivens sp.]